MKKEHIIGLSIVTGATTIALFVPRISASKKLWNMMSAKDKAEEIAMAGGAGLVLGIVLTAMYYQKEGIKL